MEDKSLIYRLNASQRRGIFCFRNIGFTCFLMALLSLLSCKGSKCLTKEAQSADSPAFESDFEDRPALIPAWSIDSGNCEQALTEITFINFLGFLEQENDIDKRLDQSLEVVEKHCITSYQLSRIGKLFKLESDKLSLAKFAFSKVYDPQNFHWMTDQLVLLSSKEEIQKLLDNINSD